MMFGFGGIWMALFWVAVLLIPIWLVWQFTTRRNTDQSIGTTPEEIARRRYARGEIGREELDRLLSDLHRYRSA
ncbi:MAG: SHOCT domain-containing protein [Candidatus Zixiibacteriota bacterium]|nr:MAG: SHOCT domain-containing protein [candidate division Zixibacteria bacterium]